MQAQGLTYGRDLTYGQPRKIAEKKNPGSNPVENVFLEFLEVCWARRRYKTWEGALPTPL